MDLISDPPLSSFNYNVWKLKMIAFLKSHELFDVSIGVVAMPESNHEKSIWFNNCNRAYGAMCLAIPPRMRYRIDVVEFPSEIWSRLDKSFGQQTEEISAKHWESASGISFQVIPTSIISQEYEFLPDEEMTKSSTIQFKTRLIMLRLSKF